jgi:hypothetical protein
VFVDVLTFPSDTPPPDTTDPVVTQLSGPNNESLSSEDTFVFESNEPVTFECAWTFTPTDPGTSYPFYRACGGSTTPTTLTKTFDYSWITEDREAEFLIKATDPADNETKVRRYWIVDVDAPDTSRIYFDSDAYPNDEFHISSIRPDGTDLQALAPNTAPGVEQSLPTVNSQYSNGNLRSGLIAFAEDHDSNPGFSDLVFMGHTGSEARRYPSNGRDSVEFVDSTQVVYAFNGGIALQQFFDLDMPDNVVLDPTGIDYDPSGARNGRLAWINREQGLMTPQALGVPGVQNPNFADLSGAEINRFGTKIAYAYQGDLWTVNVDGSNPQLLVGDGDVQSPTWAPLGTKIAFRLATTTNGVYGVDIYTVNPDGTNLQNVTNTPDSEEQYLDWGPPPQQ